MRDSTTIPVRPLRDLSAEARAAVAASRARKVDVVDKTLYVRGARPRSVPVPVVATTSSSVSLIWAGVIAALVTWIAALALCLLA